MYIQVFYPVRKQLASAGWVKYQHVPALFAEGVSYLPEPNRYLRELATGDWRPTESRSAKSREFTPTPTTLTNSAEYLANFLRWCAEYTDDAGIPRPLDWRDADYRDHVIDGYQKDMSEGRWGLWRLKAGTVNLRGDEATRFLEWAAWRGYRGPIDVAKETKQAGARSGNHSHGHRQRTTEVRSGRARASPEDLFLPSRESVAVWLEEVKRLHGPTKGLMTELIIKTGIRLAECGQWRADTLPESRADWNIVSGGGFVQVRIRAGNKGGDRQEDEEGELTLHPVGRDIDIPIEVAEKLHDYRNTTRAVARKKYVRDPNASQAQRNVRAKEKVPLRLFLSDSLGVPFTGQTLRNAWKRCPSLPMPEWSPHLGRHYYACYFLLGQIEKQVELMKSLDRKTAMLVASSPAFVSNAWHALQQQFGHIDTKTTERYTKWLRRATENTLLSLSNLQYPRRDSTSST